MFFKIHLLYFRDLNQRFFDARFLLIFIFTAVRLATGSAGCIHIYIKFYLPRLQNVELVK